MRIARKPDEQHPGVRISPLLGISCPLGLALHSAPRLMLWGGECAVSANNPPDEDEDFDEERYEAHEADVSACGHDAYFWPLDGAAPAVWQRLRTTGEKPHGLRSGSAACVDAACRQLFLWGGGQGVYSDASSVTRERLWQLDLTTGVWSVLDAETCRPPVRIDHSITLLGDILVVCGGYELDPPRPPSPLPLLAFDLRTRLWSTLPQSGAVPPVLSSHSAWPRAPNVLLVARGCDGLWLRDGGPPFGTPRASEYNLSNGVWRAVDGMTLSGQGQPEMHASMHNAVLRRHFCPQNGKSAHHVLAVWGWCDAVQRRQDDLDFDLDDPNAKLDMPSLYELSCPPLHG
jgi:hypothetical protein